MRLGLKEAWVGWRRRIAVCPHCSSGRVRFSRRRYEGPWFLLFRVLPVRCSSCGAVFPVARGGSIARVEDPADLHLPFEPSELEARLAFAPDSARGGPAPRRFLLRPGRAICPICGSTDVRPSRPESDPAPSRLDAKITYRCVRCNASFGRNSAARLLILGLILFGVLAVLSYLTLAALRPGGRRETSPTIRQKQVPPLPPPVLR